MADSITATMTDEQRGAYKYAEMVGKDPEAAARKAGWRGRSANASASTKTDDITATMTDEQRGAYKYAEMVGKDPEAAAKAAGWTGGSTANHASP